LTGTKERFFVLDFEFCSGDGIVGFYVEVDVEVRTSDPRLDFDFHPTRETKDQVKSRIFLDVVVGEGTRVFELLSSEDEALLVRLNSFLVVYLLFHVFDEAIDM